MAKREWETFLDYSYFHLHAVRPIGDKDFNSSLLFHIVDGKQAEHLKDFLNELDAAAYAKENNHGISE